MYPTLYHALLDLTGLDFPFLKFLNSFGFFVAVAFFFASWTLSLELRRKEGLGLLQPLTQGSHVGAAASPLELITQRLLLGFLLGLEGVASPVELRACHSRSTRFLLSGHGLLDRRLLGGAYSPGPANGMRRTSKAGRTEGGGGPHASPRNTRGNITSPRPLGIIGAKLFHWLENPDEFVGLHPRTPAATRSSAA
jgi:phosphatidylglycerol:prolipoprotein diacylglycerol transferase